MTPDHQLTLLAAVLFAAIAIFFSDILRRFTRARRLKPPPPALQFVFRLWFAALAAASLFLTFHRHH